MLAVVTESFAFPPFCHSSSHSFVIHPVMIHEAVKLPKAQQIVCVVSL